MPSFCYTFNHYSISALFLAVKITLSSLSCSGCICLWSSSLLIMRIVEQSSKCCVIIELFCIICKQVYVSALNYISNIIYVQDEEQSTQSKWNSHIILYFCRFGLVLVLSSIVQCQFVSIFQSICCVLWPRMLFSKKRNTDYIVFYLNTTSPFFQ
jgi:hypothetical protein